MCYYNNNKIIIIIPTIAAKCQRQEKINTTKGIIIIITERERKSNEGQTKRVICQMSQVDCHLFSRRQINEPWSEHVNFLFFPREKTLLKNFLFIKLHIIRHHLSKKNWFIERWSVQYKKKLIRRTIKRSANGKKNMSYIFCFVWQLPKKKKIRLIDKSIP